MLYLAELIGDGTDNNHFRAPVTPGQPYSMVDLRADPRSPGMALVWTEGPELTGPTIDLIGAAPTEVLSAALRLRLGNRLSRTFDRSMSGGDLIAELLLQGGQPWRSVQADRSGLKEVWIAGRRWAKKRVPKPTTPDPVDPSDNFNRANENPIAAPWSPLSFADPARIVSNAFMGSIFTEDSGAAYDSAAATDDQFSECVIVTGTTYLIGPMLRNPDPADETFYCVRAQVGAGTEVVKTISNSYTDVEILGNSGIADGNKLRAAITGSTIKCWDNDVEITGSPSTDASIASGQVGLYARDVDGVMDDWRGGDGTGDLAPPYNPGRPNLALQQRY